DHNDYNDRYQYWVEDARGGQLGFITDEGKGFRFRAHEQPELVSAHDDLDVYVRAVMGYREGTIVLEPMR
ncbi:MAG: hypothetical protein KDB53_14155, partial [Planctomycetes bacterium]|nr:hypothetical protein [Planctomycetota bacterium]